MTSDNRALRAARGRRVPGLGRPYARLAATVAVILVAITALPALSSSDPRLTLPIPLPIPLPISLPIIGAIGGGGAPTSPPTTTTTTPTGYPVARGRHNPFSTRAMWIWELGSSSGGDLAQIIAKAKSYGVGMLIIKSSDGTQPWAQFTPELVSALRAAGLRVCAWQYVYGRVPAKEARLGADAVREGAACLVIDAESEYQGRYHAAQRYLSLLRQQVGKNFPIGLAGLPYVDYHPGFPYSVFLGPGGAQYNLPQMYWKDIGVSVDQVFAHTYMYNRVYLRPIYPLGQLFDRPRLGQIIRFRQLAAAYGARGVSWWDYQEASGSNWRAIDIETARPAGFVPDPQVVTLSRGSKGDLVVWAQEHLYAAADRVHVDGDFGPLTLAAVESFQAAHRLLSTGAIDAGTWAALLKYKPAHVNWALHSNKHGIAHTAGISSTTPPPQSASLPGHNELRGALGRGR